MSDFFHVLNRGVDKRTVFIDRTDYIRFIHDLWEFNDTRHALNVRRRTSNISGGGETESRGRKNEHRARNPLVRIHFFCLMPNHYHLLISPIDDNYENVSLFMKKLNGGYSKYFNEKYTRSGALWQGKYKSVPIETDAHFMHIPYYIHFNPLDMSMPEWRERKIVDHNKAVDFLHNYRWSSHLDYLGEKNFPSVTYRNFFLDFFGGEKKYAQKIKNMLRTDMSHLDAVTLE